MRHLWSGFVAGGLAVLLWQSTASAGKPAWIEGKDPSLPAAEWLLAVGSGSNKDSADGNARAEMSRIFEAQVQSVMHDYESYSSKAESGGKGSTSDIQDIKSLTQVFSNQKLEGVELKYRAQEGSQYFTLAVLNRSQASNSLRERIGKLDEEIDAAMSTGDGAGDPVKKFKSYGKALSKAGLREAFNAQLRVVERTGKGIPSKHSIADIGSKFDEASGNLKIGVQVAGMGNDKVKDCLVGALTAKGMQVEVAPSKGGGDGDDDDDDDSGGGGGGGGMMSGVDLVVDGKITHDKAQEVGASKLVKSSLSVRLINAKTKKVIGTWSESRKEGRGDLKQSVQLGVHKICQMLVPKIADAIEKQMK